MNQYPPDPRSPEEIEANYFAAHLLAPTAMLREEVAKLGRPGLDLSDDDDTIDKLARTFEVSRNLIAFRLGEEGFFNFNTR